MEERIHCAIQQHIVQTVSMQCTSMVQPLLSVRDQILRYYLQLIDSAVGFILHTLSSASSAFHFANSC